MTKKYGIEYFKVSKGFTPKKDKAAQLKIVDSETVVDYSDGIAPIGVFTGGKIQKRKDGRYVPVAIARNIRKTSIYASSERYPINANLFINEDGDLTTNQYNPFCPAVGIVVKSPTAINAQLEYMWL